MKFFDCGRIFLLLEIIPHQREKRSKFQEKGLFTDARNIIFQAEHALYNSGLDENRGNSDFVHDIWIPMLKIAVYKILYTTVVEN